MNQLKRLGLGMGKDPLVQNIADYGSGALLGVAGQQGANWLTGGADPNPLISGALMAPALTQALRYGRGRFAPQGSDMAMMNNAMVDRTMASTSIPSYALLGSAAALGGGALASAQNIAFGGNDIDNNIPASILAGAVPLTAYLMNRRANPSVNRGNMFGTPSGKTYDYHSVPQEGYVRDPNPDNRYRR